jgi:hypothetical protein
MQTELKQYHVLNATAGRIWSLADGTRTIDQITEEIASEYGMNPSAIEADVVDTVNGLYALRLFETA